MKYYFRVQSRMPSKDKEPLLELDKEGKKFEVFLEYHRSNLWLGDLKMFLAFTINLDPHIKEIIKGINIKSKSLQHTNKI